MSKGRWSARCLTKPLTDAERVLCEENHNIIYDVMRHYYITDPGLDVYGECAMALMAAAQKYRTTERLQSYAFSTIAYNHIRSVLGRLVHKAKKHPALSLDKPCTREGSLYGEILTLPRTVYQCSTDTLTLYMRCMERLTVRQQDVLCMHGSGMTHTEIASVLQIPVSTVGTRLHYARKKCAGMMKNEKCPAGVESQQSTKKDK